MGAKIKCLLCNDVIESKHRHDFVTCKCGACFVDGGDDYLRIGGTMSDMVFVNEDGTTRPLEEGHNNETDVGC